MPRGGRRPGAGAPKGNFNGITTGNRSARMRLVYLALIAWPDKRELAQVLHRAGLIDSRGRFDKRRDFAPTVAFLYHYFFIDRQEAIAAKSLSRAPLRTHTDPAPEAEGE